MESICDQQTSQQEQRHHLTLQTLETNRKALELWKSASYIKVHSVCKKYF